VCYTPMLKAEQLVLGGAEERRLLESCDGDRPLVAQLAGRDPQALAQAVRIVLEAVAVDAVDLNLGCPQECAREGGYGAFLQEEPATAAACVEAMCEAAAPLPVFCKMRILSSAQASISFAQGLEAAGCSLLAVHGRTREAKHEGSPDFGHLAELAAALRIPVVANGGIRSREQARAVMERTGAAAVMVATGLLRWPRAFSLESPCTEPQRADEGTADVAMEYLRCAEEFPPPSPLYLRKHLRWLFRAELERSFACARAGWLEGRDADQAEWRVRAWTFLEQPCLTELWQFRELVRLIAHHQGRPLGPKGPSEPPVLSFKEIRAGEPSSADGGAEPDVGWLFAAE